MMNGIPYRATQLQQEKTGSFILSIKLVAAVVAASPFDADWLACQSIVVR
jgi:hypothetical protein